MELIKEPKVSASYTLVQLTCIFPRLLFIYVGAAYIKVHILRIFTWPFNKVEYAKSLFMPVANKTIIPKPSTRNIEL